MLKNNKGQTGAWEGIIILILLIVIGGLVYLVYSKKSESNIYQDGSKPKVTQYDVAPKFGGCVSIQATEYMENRKNGVINSQVNRH